MNRIIALFIRFKSTEPVLESRHTDLLLCPAELGTSWVFIEEAFVGTNPTEKLFLRRTLLRAMATLPAAYTLLTIACVQALPVSNERKRSDMEIRRVGSQPSAKGPAEWFTGAVRVDALFYAPDPALVQGVSVTFEPGARTAWHTHPLGQTLVVIAGVGLAQRWGGPIEEIRPGDVVWFSPGEKHWHGATPTTAMTHIAVQERKEGKAVDWMEHVSDEQYQRPGQES